jgi:hypothetical protein
MTSTSARCGRRRIGDEKAGRAATDKHEAAAQLAQRSGDADEQLSVGVRSPCHSGKPLLELACGERALARAAVANGVDEREQLIERRVALGGYGHGLV